MLRVTNLNNTSGPKAMISAPYGKKIEFTDTTASTSTTTGAITVAGGVGIAGALNVGGKTHIAGKLEIDSPGEINSLGRFGVHTYSKDCSNNSTEILPITAFSTGIIMLSSEFEIEGTYVPVPYTEIYYFSSQNNGADHSRAKLTRIHYGPDGYAPSANALYLASDASGPWVIMRTGTINGVSYAPGGKYNFVFIGLSRKGY